MIKYSFDDRMNPAPTNPAMVRSDSSSNSIGSSSKSLSGQTGNSLQAPVENMDLDLHPRLSKYDYCVKWSSNRPVRSHHCSICKICVVRMDHHCSWVSNCVGLYNHKFYLLFLIYTSLLGAFMTLNTAIEYKDNLLGLVFLNGTSDIWNLVGLLSSLMISIITGNLVIYQIQICLLDRTTLEDLTGNYDKNIQPRLANLRKILGESVLLWWVPTKPN